MLKEFNPFYNDLQDLENWLNSYAQKGYRIVNVNKSNYELCECPSAEYSYYVGLVKSSEFDNLKEKYESELIKAFKTNLFIKSTTSKKKISLDIRGQLWTSPEVLNNWEIVILETKNNTQINNENLIKDLKEYKSLVSKAIIKFKILLSIILFSSIVLFTICSFILQQKIIFILIDIIMIILTIYVFVYCNRIKANVEL
ncbi:DUF2812 domain-containing protein [Sedimentibacter sp. zth1]|uniref:DUF2812 domain-containing protein n=1 Tax=Sedimentibacter sp. zth1 TaxID=2816908 RepID=UPI001A91CBC7|nr:DUF2812 domain-containing protein [Sedimentibacter sp. zth1]QSX05665.1 DUF2812 domain-containing protein [Sedimentibacter sp. zth1]